MKHPTEDVRIVINSLQQPIYDVLLNLYKTILKNDRSWHFFIEGAEIAIRCSAVSKTYIERILTFGEDSFYDSIEFRSIPYVENIPPTKRYMNFFMRFFHETSIMAMKMDPKDFMDVFERVNHCFYNQLHVRNIEGVLFSPKSDLERLTSEATFLSVLSVTRAFSTGYYHRENQIRFPPNNVEEKVNVEETDDNSFFEKEEE